MTDYTPEELLELEDDRFRKLVEDEARSATTVDAAAVTARNSVATSEALRDPLVIERFYTELLVLRAGVEGRLAAKKAHFAVTRVSLLGAHPGRPTVEYLEAKKAYADARARSLRFKTSLDQTLLDVRRLREAVRANARVVHLETGIRRWWASFEGEEEPDDDDRELWRHVAGG